METISSALVTETRETRNKSTSLKDLLSPFSHENNPEATFEDDFYPITNEKGMEAVTKALSSTPSTGNIMIGVSGLQNLTYFLSCDDKVDTLIIIDPNLSQVPYWKCICSSIKESATGEEATEAFLGKLEEEKLFDYEIPGKLKRLKLLLESPKNPFLRNFARLQKLVKEERLIHVAVNLADTDACEKFRACLTSSGEDIALLYLSNVHHWIGDQPLLRAANAFLDEKSGNIILLAHSNWKGQKGAELTLCTTHRLDAIPQVEA